MICLRNPLNSASNQERSQLHPQNQNQLHPQNQLQLQKITPTIPFSPLDGKPVLKSQTKLPQTPQPPLTPLPELPTMLPVSTLRAGSHGPLRAANQQLPASRPPSSLTRLTPSATSLSAATPALISITSWPKSRSLKLIPEASISHNNQDYKKLYLISS